MKKLLAVLGLAVLIINAPARAEEAVTLSADSMNALSLQALGMLSPAYLINWKVGDTANYKITIASMPFGGTMVESVTKDEGDTLWYRQDMNMIVQKQVVDAQIDKSTAKILKMLVNGKEQAIPDDKLTIISQEYTEITVAAGHFKCMHIVAKSDKISNLEVWANPKDAVMDGSLKTNVTQQGMNISMELQSFTRGQ